MFTDKVGDLPLSKISDRTAVAFLDGYLLGERKQKPMTRNSYAMLFSAIYKCAIRRKKATVKSVRWPADQAGGGPLPALHRPGDCHAIRRRYQV